ncbi:MAG: hypothetical protein NAG76_22910 [Candidatus Pristimantibacillus lignocellulolyticus]|uniref:Uncharacterized protein n=1 Tax=Candidatus Pristimantibacillus lignocellulolyticus TaxID=2994561 RepID=A0A9J6ZF21_9BACL|nr:MAG: hypothetical protein NAG76_22910 [Candidatus Pristimantibacillus lignocellulolyticus]
MQLTTNLKLKKPEIADAVNIDDLNSNADTIDTEVAKIASTSQAGRMSITDKTKLDGIQAGAQVNAVTSVSGRTGAVTLAKTDVGLSSVDNAKQATKTEFDSHVADEVKHITATERTTWNAKASTAAATTSAAGLMVAADKSKLDGIAVGANNYVHPANHPASIITQDASNRFVTDAEKTAWNAKANLSDIDSRTRYGVTTGTATALVLTLTPAPSALYAGMEVKVKLHVATGTNPTLNVNNLGAKSLYIDDSTRFSGEGGKIHSFVYDGANFYLSSGGGGGGMLNVYNQLTGWPDTGRKRFRGLIMFNNDPITSVVTDNNVWNANQFETALMAQIPALTTSNFLGAAIGTIGNYIYLFDCNFGGALNIATPRYNTQTNTWDTNAVANNPLPAVSSSCLVVNNIAYLYGGSRGGSSNTRMYSYNPANNTWTKLADAPTALEYPGCVAVGTKLYYFAGHFSATAICYDIPTNTWSQLYGMPASMRGVSAGYYGGKIYVQEGNSNFTCVYTIATNTWTTITFIPGISGNSYTNIKQTVQLGNVLYSAGLAGPNSYCITALDLVTLKLTVYSHSTTTSFFHFAGLAYHNNSIYVIGAGYSSGDSAANRNVLRFRLTPKSFPAGTAIIVRSSNTIGKYYTELMSPDKEITSALSLLETGFDDIVFHNGTTIVSNLESYYGNGSSWQRFK